MKNIILISGGIENDILATAMLKLKNHYPEGVIFVEIEKPITPELEAELIENGVDMANLVKTISQTQFIDSVKDLDFEKITMAIKAPPKIPMPEAMDRRTNFDKTRKQLYHNKQQNRHRSRRHNF